LKKWNGSVPKSEKDSKSSRQRPSSRFSSCWRKRGYCMKWYRSDGAFRFREMMMEPKTCFRGSRAWTERMGQ
jgi:hypothetical protein